MANIINYNPESYKVEYELGTSGRKLALDLGDINFPDRYMNARDNILKYVDTILKKKGVKNFDDLEKLDTGDVDEDRKTLKEADAYIKNEIDKAFDSNVSAVAFGCASCLSVERKTGTYYFENFLNAVLPVIEEEYNVRLHDAKGRVEKYSKLKGKHSK